MAYKQKSKDISGLMMKMKSPLNYGGKSAMMKTGDPEKKKQVKYDAKDEQIRKDQFKQTFYDKYNMPPSDAPEMFKREYEKSIEGSWKKGDVKPD